MIHITEKYPLADFIDWEIKEQPVYNANGEILEGWKTIINDQTNKPINIVRNSYTPVPNYRLAEICEGFERSGSFTLKGFATYGRGEKVLGYLQSNSAKPLAGQEGESYLLVGNSHDGSTAFFTGFTNIIYRCENMFSSFNKQNRMRHSENIEREIRAMEETMDLFYNQETGIYETTNIMADVPISEKERRALIWYALDINPEDLEYNLSSRKKNQIDDLVQAMRQEMSVLGATVWGAFNGVTKYTTHVTKQKKPIFGNPFNTANRINQRAFEFCSNLAKKAEPAIFKALLEAPQQTKAEEPKNDFISDVEPIQEQEQTASNC